MKRKFDTIGTICSDVRANVVNVELAVEEFVWKDMTLEEKQELESHICAVLREIEQQTRTLQRKASIYREIANKPDAGDK